jgi:biotin transport system substrate-specific component
MNGLSQSIKTFALPSLKSGISPLIQILGATCFIALCAQIRIPLPFSPVPLTLQTFAMLMVGGALGSRKGVASVLLYLAAGFMGMPMMLEFFGPRGGYLMGFIVQAYLMGAFLENRPESSSTKIFTVSLLICLLQLSMGVVWLSNFVGWNSVFLMGLYPFIPGEILKSLVVAKYFSKR